MTRLELAEAMLTDAKRNLENGGYRTAVSRAYYSCYHAARACLEKKGIEVTSREPHKATISLFGLHLVISGFFPSWMGRTLNELYDDRIDADYKVEAQVTEALAKSSVSNAERFLKEVKEKWSILG
jgi:hypothetical protein